MTLTLFEQCRKKRLQIQYTAVIFAIAFVYAAVCTPINIWAYSDILISESLFLPIWNMVMIAVNYSFYWVSFAYLLYFASRFTIGHIKGILGIYVGASFFFNAASLLASGIMNGFSDMMLRDFWDILMTVALDAVQMAVAVLIVYLLLTPMQRLAERRYLLERTKNEQASLKMPQWLPFEGLFDLKNKLARASAFCALISFTTHVITRVIYDVFFGAPKNTADLLWIIFAYLTELVALLIGYLVIILILNQLYLKEEQRREKFHT